MIWDARDIDDRTYHRRRFILAIVLGVIGLALVASRVQHIRSVHSNVWDFISVAIWLGMIVYAVLLGMREFRAMQQSERR